MEKLFQPVASSRPWSSPGVASKPAHCATCRYSHYTTGFVPDYFGAEPKIAVLLKTPDKSEVTERTCLEGDWGWFFLHNFIPKGYAKKNLIISHVLRCNTPWDKKRKAAGYPTGAMKEQAESTCRYYDAFQGHNGDLVAGGIASWSPNLFLITCDPREVFKVNSYFRQIKRDFTFAFKLAEQGFKPVVLCGNEAAELFFPVIRGSGGAKSWRGHFEEIPASRWSTTGVVGLQGFQKV